MKDKRREIKNSRRGLGLPLAVVIVVVLAILGIGLIQLGLHARLQAIRDVAVVSARTAADAGIEHAVRYMVNGWNSSNPKSAFLTAWNDATVWTNPGVPATPVKYLFGPVQLGGTFGDAEFQYKIYKGTFKTGYQIISTGTAAGQSRTVHAAAVLKSALVGAGAKESININVGAGLGSIPNGSELVIQTNSITSPPAGGVMLRQGLTVPGDVVVGPGGDTDVAIIEKKDVIIEGDAKSAEEPIDFPSIYPPNPPLQAGSVVVPDPLAPTVGYIYGTILPQQFNGLTVGSPSAVKILYIQGNPAINGGVVQVYVAGPTLLSADAQLIVTVGTTLELYLGGAMDAKAKSVITYGGVLTTPEGIIEAAKHISIKGTDSCTSVKLFNDGDFYGSVYAPMASVEIGNKGNFYGAVVGGSTIDIKNSGNFIYIPDLLDLPDVEVLYMGIKHGSWWEE